MNLIDQRCFNHAPREAVARCPECRRCFCRECTVEHAGRMLCAGCLERLLERRHSRQHRFGASLLAAQFALAFVFLWFFFYSLGTMLIHLPSSFHEQTLWHRQFLELE